MPHVTAPIGDGPLAAAIRKLARTVPDEPTLYEVIRRRLLAIVAESGLTVTETARRGGVRHQTLVRKLLPAGADDHRGLDTETVEAVLGGLGVKPDRLVRIDHQLADVEVLRHLSDLTDTAQADLPTRRARELARDRVAIGTADASERWPDAGPRIARLVALGFLAPREDGAYALTPTGRACAAR